eukprot:g14006.t1
MGVATIFDAQPRLEMGDVIVPLRRLGNDTTLCSVYLELDGPPNTVMRAESVDLWHRRLGHINRGSLDVLRKIDDNGVDYTGTFEACDVCAIGKSAQRAHPKNATYDVSRPFQLVSTDLMGPMSPPALGGFQYVGKLVDEKTKWKEIFLIKIKSDAIKTLRIFNQSLVVPSGFRLERLRADKGTEYTCREFRETEDDDSGYEPDIGSEDETGYDNDDDLMRDVMDYTSYLDLESPTSHLSVIPSSSDTNDMQQLPKTITELRRLALYTNTPLADIGHREERINFLEHAFVADSTQLRSCSEGEKVKTIPNTFKEAMELPETKLWKAATDKETKSLQDLNVYKLVPRTGVPLGHKVIGSKWVFKVKPDNTHKARLVAKGWNQVRGRDCGGTFAPVCRLQSIRMVLAIAAEKDLEVIQLDVKTAFLYADIEEDVFVEMAPGYEITNEEGTQLVMKLEKSLYGLAQSPQNWWKTIDPTLVEIGFVSLNQLSIFFATSPGLGTSFSITYKKGGFDLTAFSDSNWGNNPDNGKSMSSYIMMMCMAPVSFKAGLQSLTAMSTMEAELVAAALVMKEVIFCTNMMTELGFGSEFRSAPLYIDNTATLNVIGNQTFSGRTKHVALRFFYIREIMEEGRISIHYVPTEDNLADIGTKHLNKQRHKYLIDKIQDFGTRQA